MTNVYKGGCLCGRVRYVAEAEPINQRICHCRLCQQAIGAAFNARLLFRIDDVAVTGEPAGRHSSENLERVFCAACGTTLFSKRAGLGLMGVTSGSLDDPSQFKPEIHIWTSSKQSWLKLDDGLPQYPEHPPG